METLRLVTWVNAPVDRCFKLSLSVDLQLEAAKKTRQKAVDGVTTGLIGAGETVKWSGRHFGRRWSYTSVIDAYRPFLFFRDVMVEGAFKHFDHEHHFAALDDGTRIREEIRFSAPMGWLGRLAEKTFLRHHLLALMKQRNAVIKRVAESEEWHRYLEATPEVDPTPGVGGGAADVMKKRELQGQQKISKEPVLRAG